MSQLNEIKSSIASVNSTRKITRAMYLTSASKSRRAKAQLEKTRPFFHRVNVVLSEILATFEEDEDDRGGKVNELLRSPFIGENEETADKPNLYIVMSGDKGMAGGYNHNIINFLDANVDKATAELWVAGSMGRSRIKRKGYNVSPDFTYQVMNPTLDRAWDVAQLVVKAFLSGEYHQVHLIYTQMITSLRLEPAIAQLLPLNPEEITQKAPVVGKYEKTSFEPNPRAVFEHLTPYYLKGVVYGAFVDAYTSEQNARMYAMDNATNSATDMIESLSLSYNRSRQAHVTQEINEIVGGIPTD